MEEANDPTGNRLISPPKYEQLRSIIREQIRSGELSVDERIGSEDELAKRYGVARGTVRQALRLLENDGLVETRHGKGTFVRRTTPFVQTKMLSFISTDPEHDVFSNEFYLPILHTIERQARSRRMKVLYTNFTSDEMVHDEELFFSHVGDGSFVVRHLPPRTAEKYRCNRLPVVLIGNTTDEKLIDSVIADNRRGARLATGFLLERGHRRILHIQHDMGTATGIERRDGHLEALREAGVEPDDRLLVRCDTKNPDQLKTTLRRLQSNGVAYTAIFAGSDHRAMMVMEYLQEEGLRIPDDVSLVGFDDITVAAHSAFDLTTVAVDKNRMGSDAFDLVLRRMENPAVPAESRVAPVSMVERGSVRPVG
jgi:DNA-binding LacI/PurR family transcriptional regulator